MRDRHVRPRRCPGAAYRGPRTRTTAATAAPAFICTRRVLASPHVARTHSFIVAIYIAFAAP